MRSKLILIILNFLFNFSINYCATTNNNNNNNTLILTHVLFRHGQRTPEKYELYELNKFFNESFYHPYGYGQLTNKGKLSAYNLGRSLKKRYKNFLINQSWNTKLADALTTDYDRTKMSLSLVLGGLFPPNQKEVSWNPSLKFQAIPYRYVAKYLDKELLSFKCGTFVSMYYSNKNVLNHAKYYDNVMEILQDNIQEEVTYAKALNLYVGMKIQEDLGFKLDNWTQQIYPEQLQNYLIQMYSLLTSTKEFKINFAGHLLKKIISDSLNKINGNLEPKERKFFLYSAHDVNVFILVTALTNFQFKSIPPYSSYVILELHNINGINGFKMFYNDYTDGKKLKQLKITGCKKFCPIDEFLKLTEDILPSSNSLSCYPDNNN